MKNDQLKYQLFQEQYQLYCKDLQRFIYSLTRKDLYAMEEIFQNTMVQALQGLNQLKEAEKMRSWLFSIAKTEAKRYYSKNSNFIHLEFNDVTEMEWNHAIEFDDYTKVIEDKNFVLFLINRLTDEEAQIFILHFIYDLSLKEISKILHLNNNTVRIIKFRGLNKCRKLCEKGCNLMNGIGRSIE